MKRFLILTIAIASPFIHAQDKPAAPASTAKPNIEVQAPLTPKTSTPTNIVIPKEPVVRYGGLATDIKRSTNRWKMFSLRKPADPKNDDANLIKETRTEGARPIKLFSIDF